MKSKWFYKNKKVDNSLADEFGLHPALVKIMADRGVEGKEAVQEYMNLSLESIPTGEELVDMKKGVNIILQCIREKKPIRIMGDYDVDGVTSTYILFSGLSALGADCDFFIPDRIKDGYGLHEDAIRQAYDDGRKAILTCDNGISACKEIELAKKLGMTVVVTDHHEVPYETGADGERHYIIPPADAVIDPKREDNGDVFREICGAVVAWKFVGCLYRQMGKEEEFKNSDFLEMAALATICDVMELQHENRAIVREGLVAFKNTKNIGLRAILHVLGLEEKDLTSYDFGFKVGPCINAAGRLENASKAFALFTEKEEDKALEKAEYLRALNEKRQQLTEEGMEQAFDIIDNTMQNDRVLVVFLPNLHESIAGIVAGKVRERYCRPAFVLAKSKNGTLKGSGRSIEAFSMYDELVKCKDLLLGFGGHPLAAGVSLKEENLEAFRKKINENCALTDEDMIPKTYIDVILPVDYLTPRLIEQLSLLEPFGKGNEKPVFAQRHVKAYSASIIGKNSNVLRINLASKNCKKAVCFSNVEEMEQKVKEKLNDFSIIYYPSLNEWNGRVDIQAVVEDVC